MSEPIILTPQGKPARAAVAVKTCPGCGKGPEFRKPAGAFGEKFDHCIHCGHEFREAE